MLRLVLTFGVGVYAGIYITQNYEVPRVDEPSKLWEKVKEWADSHKKRTRRLMQGGEDVKDWRWKQQDVDCHGEENGVVELILVNKSPQDICTV